MLLGSHAGCIASIFFNSSSLNAPPSISWSACASTRLQLADDLRGFVAGKSGVQANFAVTGCQSLSLGIVVAPVGRP